MGNPLEMNSTGETSFYNCTFSCDVITIDVDIPNFYECEFINGITFILNRPAEFIKILLERLTNSTLHAYAVIYIPYSIENLEITREELESIIVSSELSYNKGFLVVQYTDKSIIF